MRYKLLAVALVFLVVAVDAKSGVLRDIVGRVFHNRDGERRQPVRNLLHRITGRSTEDDSANEATPLPPAPKPRPPLREMPKKVTHDDAPCACGGEGDCICGPKCACSFSDYWRAEAKARRENRPLLVWVACQPHATIPGAIHCTLTDAAIFPDAAGALVVGKPSGNADAPMDRIDLSAQATAETISAALTAPPKAAPPSPQQNRNSGGRFRIFAAGACAS